ncbi:MAG: methyltransferase domain-containing protein [Planctomycetaceae bacterium]|nr:methyltransferase domain-containing protein [Planctomycetaceae bacterium]
MISCPTVEKRVIRTHYNVSTLFYRLLWGNHIHHGLWHGEESPRQAARQLTERMISEIGIENAAHVVDIGCGMGGSSIHLAKHHDCHVTGVTISSFQRRWAAMSSRWHGTASRTNFICHDAESVELPAQSFDVAWSIECTEHLFDKPAFFRRMAGWLKPGARVGICAWLAGDDPLTDVGRQQVYDVCEGFFCPSLGSEADYVQWLTDAGLTVTRTFDWTQQVLRTWEICLERINRTAMRKVAKVVDRGQLIFLDRFQTILDAYRTRAMKYGCFIAEKPATEVHS